MPSSVPNPPPRRTRAFGPVLLSLAVGGLFGVSVAGCGASAGNTGSLQGTVTMGGTPLARGSVLATSEGGGNASATIGPDGRYALKTRTGADPEAGEYRIAVVAYKDSSDTSPEAVLELLVPQRYADPETSGLTATVTAGQTTTQDFALAPK